MKTNFALVKEFHRTFGLPCPNKITIPDYETLILRCKLIDEETKEFKNALDNETIYEVAKELADALYVWYGAAVTLGIDIDAVFAEVHRSNMTKLDENGQVIRRADGKVLKSKLYEKADIRKVLD
jgi:predicted HAD superfamily Cof-like phosphohydrolase